MRRVKHSNTEIEECVPNSDRDKSICVQTDGLESFLLREIRRLGKQDPTALVEIAFYE
jgi:hypothetical protein